MNIFRDFNDIMGLDSAAPPVGVLQEFFTLAGEVRVKLGGKAYLLDRYLSYLLEAANEVVCEEAAGSGSMAGQGIRVLCHNAADGGHGQADHPLHDQLNVYLETHPLPFQEPLTKGDILVVVMMDAYMRIALKAHAGEVQQKMMCVADMVHVRRLFDEISTMLGSDAPMERLNLLFRQRFLAVPVMAAFAQGLTHDLLYALIHRDPETSKQVFQLILDYDYPIGVGGGDHA